jgi:two-component system nitrate/nitrite response regulator NarL
LVLVDDRPMFCRGLQLLLPSVTADRVQVAGSTGDAAAAAGLVRHCRPDLVLVDLALPAPGGVRAIGAIRHTEPAVPVVALSRAGDAESALAALKSGATGLLPAASEPEALVAPLLSVVNGYAVLPPEILDRLIERGNPAAGAVARLSPRERQLCRLVASGNSTAELAVALHVSERTVKRLVAALLRQLRVSSRTEAAALAGRAGLLDRPA